ncbi:acyltransferase family protein [Gluconacetobacter tumulicola]|uniref:Acyltransferase n=1 Tax=Gluconacetobacter tumulicola TaxID=1017177 RepID=A0A7W4JBV5_9PROT|nr:acyltransferase [Gluconacetobacter tumulicola]MBB2178390.1 acyltransferase [Gluconacetobacter tumulicola]
MTNAASGTGTLDGRNPGIDLVRGASILLVVSHHMALRIPLAKTGLAGIVPLPLLRLFSWFGYEAVFLFFVVSGFLVTSHTIRRWGSLSTLDPRAFYARRLARIAPCLLALVAILSVLDLFGVPNYTITRADQTLPRAIVSALTMHLNWYEGHTGYLPGGWDVLWSLSIEELFYLGFPALCLCLAGIPRLRTSLFALLALSLPLALDALANAPEIWREKAYLPGLAAIATGVCAAVTVAGRPTPRPGIVNATGCFALLALLAVFLKENALWSLLGNMTMLVLTLGCALLLVAFQWGWGRHRLMRGTRWLRSYGFMSYEIYLTHMFVVFPLVGLFHLSGGDMRTGWLWFPPAFALSWLLGWATDRLVSTPANRLLRGWLQVGAPPRTPPKGIALWKPNRDA